MDRIAWIKKRIKVNENGCWEWQGWKNKGGYGNTTISDNGIEKRWRVSRLMWTLHNGSIPKGKMICHHCDNPACANIEHLYLGDAKTNRRDCIVRGRMNLPCGENHWEKIDPKKIPRGSKRGQAKLTEDAAREILSMRCKNGKLPYGMGRFFARKYGVVLQTISKVVHEEKWKHVV